MNISGSSETQVGEGVASLRPIVRKVFQWAILCLVAVILPAQAEVRLPNGEYRTTVTDLRAKTLGGSVSIERTWQATNLNRGEFRWYVNPAWADLDLEIDSSDGSIRSIKRAGAKFIKQGEDLYVLKESDRAYFIRVTRDAAGVRTGLTWSDRRGNVIEYDVAGRILGYRERSGVSVHFLRDAEGRIATVSDHHDQTLLTFNYENSQLASISDYSGRQVQYHYTNGELTEVIDVLGHAWGYTYTGGLLHTQTDPENHTTTIEYASKRATKVTDAQGFITTYRYDYNRGTRQYDVTVTYPEGKVSVSRYDAEAKLLRQEIGTRLVSRVIKDSANVDISYDERGLPTRTEYDANRNPIKITYPDGSSTSATWDARFSLPLTRTDELGVTSKYEYDSQGNLLTLTEALGLPEQRITTATYDAVGQRLTQTVKGATPAEDSTTAWTYDAHGNVETITDAEQHTTTLEHDVMGNVTQRTDARNKIWISATNAMGWVTSQKDPLDHETVMTYDTVGNRLTMTDPEGHTTTYTYTANDWLETVTDPLDGVTTTQYFKDGQRQSETDANQVTTLYGYDTDRRLSTITDGAGNVTTLIYGKTCANQPAAGLEGQLTATRYPTYCEEYKLDTRGNRTAVTRILPGENGEPDRRETTHLGYDAKGQSISSTDPMGRTTQTVYDALGRVHTVTDPAAGITTYTYDSRDNLKTVTDANSHTHTFTYDHANRVKAETRPLGETVKYDYDELGRPTTRTSPQGERRIYSYDDAGRRTGEDHYQAGSQNASQAIIYVFDGRNLLTGYAQTGDTESSASYVYDAEGQKIDETVTYGSGPTAITKTLHYGYEANGLKKSLTYADGTIQTTTYDKNRLASITIKDSTIQYLDYQWRVPTQVTMPGATRTLTYDPLQRPTTITSTSAAGAVIMDYDYQYDASGNITRRTTEDGDYLYSYDSLDRVTGATPPESLQQGAANPTGLPIEQYTYDGVHNRKTSAHQPGLWAYNENNELLSYGLGPEEETYAYDDNGNTRLQKTGNPQNPSKTRQFIYNAAERLSEVKDNSSTIAKYQYDPMGRRFKKEVNGVVTWFQYADEGLIAEFADNGSLLRAYGWKLGNLWSTDPEWLANVLSSTWTLNFYHNDYLGTSQRLTRDTGALAWKGQSEAFGRRSHEVQISTSNELGFPGQLLSKEINAYYNYSRDYNPDTGRYFQHDSIGLDGGINEYAYTFANPLRWVDEEGLQARAGPRAPPSHTWRNGARRDGAYSGGRSGGGRTGSSTGSGRRGASERDPYEDVNDFFGGNPRCFNKAMNWVRKFDQKFEDYRKGFPTGCIATCNICFKLIFTLNGPCPIDGSMSCPSRSVMGAENQHFACFSISGPGTGERVCPRKCPEY